MEGRCDLRKLTIGTIVAERCGMLSSGREARGDIDHRRRTTQHPAVRTARWGRGVRCNAAGTDRRIDTVKQLTRGWGIESFATLGSDQKAAEALQVAETEVGVVRVDRRTAGARATGRTYRPADTAIDVGLTA